MSECWASRSTILPFPSSPHCAPTMTVAGTSVKYAVGLGRRALAVVVAGVDVNFPGEAPQAARRGAADAARQLPPLVVRRHDHEPPLLLALVDEVVDAVARPARPVLRAEVV